MKHYLFAIIMAIALLSGCAEKDARDICVEVGEKYFNKKLDKVERNMPYIRFLESYNNEDSNGIDPRTRGGALVARVEMRLEEVLGSKPSYYKDKLNRECFSWHKDGYLATLRILNVEYKDDIGSSVELIIEKY